MIPITKRTPKQFMTTSPCISVVAPPYTNPIFQAGEMFNGRLIPSEFVHFPVTIDQFSPCRGCGSPLFGPFLQRFPLHAISHLENSLIGGAQNEEIQYETMALSGELFICHIGKGSWKWWFTMALGTQFGEMHTASNRTASGFGIHPVGWKSVVIPSHDR